MLTKRQLERYMNKKFISLVDTCLCSILLRGVWQKSLKVLVFFHSPTEYLPRTQFYSACRCYLRLQVVYLKKHTVQKLLSLLMFRTTAAMVFT